MDYPGSIISQKWQFPTLYSVTAKNQDSHWTIFVESRDSNDKTVPFDIHSHHAAYYVESGLLDGKVRDSAVTIVTKGKNIGKKSETTPVQQALRDANGLYTKQLKKSVVNDLYPPQLAQNYRLLKVPPSPPFYVQRKYNGLRAVCCWRNGKVVIYSRKREEYPGLESIREQYFTVLQANPTLHFDGELYAHGYALQDISGAVRGNKTHINLQFYCYDAFYSDNLELPFSKRFVENTLIPTKVETTLVTTTEEMLRLYHQYLDEKYEGIMIRLDHKYEFSYNDYHSRSLLKYKPTFDAEFVVTDWFSEGKGKANGALMVVCSVKNLTFNVTPALPIETRKELAKKMSVVEANGKTHFENNYKNKEITVTYDELSKDGVPQRARTELVLRPL